MKKSVLWMVFLLATILMGNAAFAIDENDNSGGPSGLPLPRFASLRVDEVNMRTGPGTRYPIEWVLVKQGMPVEIVAEYEAWRRVRDPQGDEGWVHRTGLSGRRMAIITDQACDLHGGARADAAIAAHLEKDAIGQLLSCNRDWCKLRFQGNVEGWLPKASFWGALPGEVFD